MARKFCENLDCPQPLSARRQVKKCRLAGSLLYSYLCKKCEKKNLELLKVIPIKPHKRKLFERFMQNVRLKIAANRTPTTVFGRKDE